MIGSDKYQKNFYESATEAEESAWKTLRSRSEFWIWETDEGLFQWVAIPNPSLPPSWELVGHGKTGDRSDPFGAWPR